MNNNAALLEFFRGQPVATLFLALGGGYLIGRIRLAGLTLGPVAGTLLIALLLGRYGFSISPAAQSVGFAMFIFSVGYQAGPHFIEVLKTQGLRYVALAFVVTAIGFITAVIAARLLGLPTGVTAGLMAGAMTTTPMLAAAQETVRSGIASPPPGITADQLIATIGTSYAITYIVGMLGIIAAVRLLLRFARIDLAAEAQRHESASRTEDPVNVQTRGYRVTNAQLCALSLGELRQRFWDGFAVVRLRRAGQWLSPEPHDRLQPGDELYACGNATLFRGGIAGLGEEIPVAADVGLSLTTTRVIVARPTAVGQTLGTLDFARRYGLVVTEARRDGLRLPLNPNLRLQRRDVLTVMGPLRNVTSLTETIGPVEPHAVETDMMTFAFGIAIGTLVGLLSISVRGVPIGLGSAGGMMLAGILIGWLNAARPTVGKFPEAARWVLMEFGLLIFISGVGLRSGGQIVETFQQVGFALLIAAVFVVALPVIGGYLFGRKVLRLPPVLLMGSLTGAMTSGPALSLLTSEAQSSAPALGYTGTYAFANVMLTLSGTLIMLIA